jgi:hypothetical protein
MHRFNRIAAMATIKQTERESKSLMAEVLSSSGGCVRLLLSAGAGGRWYVAAALAFRGVRVGDGA